MDGRSLSIADFLVVRSLLKASSAPVALWAGIATLALQNETQSKGKSISTRTAFEIVRYALGDASEVEVASSLREYYREFYDLPRAQKVREDLEAVTHRSVIQKNPQVISQF